MTALEPPEDCATAILFPESTTPWGGTCSLISRRSGKTGSADESASWAEAAAACIRGDAEFHRILSPVKLFLESALCEPGAMAPRRRA